MVKVILAQKLAQSADLVGSEFRGAEFYPGEIALSLGKHAFHKRKLMMAEAIISSLKMGINRKTHQWLKLSL